MSDFKFNCPHCKQSLEAPEEILGQTIDCPSCKGRIQIPCPSPKPSPQPKPQLQTPAAPKPTPSPAKGVPAPKQPNRSKAVFLAVAVLIALVLVLAGALGILLTRKEKTAPVPIGASASAPGPADVQTSRPAKEQEELTRRRQQEEESKRIEAEAAERAEESKRLAAEAARGEAEKQREKEQIQNRINKAVQLRTAKGDDRNASLLVHLAKWETDEFAKHADLKQTPVCFKGSFRPHPQKPQEKGDETIGIGLLFDDPCRIAASKYDFDNNALIMILRTDHWFCDNIMHTGPPNTLKYGAQSGSIILCPNARVDVTIAIPMTPDKAKDIRTKEENGTLTVTAVFQVENYQVERKTLRGDKIHEYLQFDVTPRVLSISFN